MINNRTSTRAGWVITQVGREIRQGRQPLGSYMEVFDAKAYVAKAGLEDAIYFYLAKYVDNIYICLDNFEVACHLLSYTTGSS